MYCMKCGTQLPAEAEFCYKCGQPQKQDLAQAANRTMASSVATPTVTKLSCPSCGGLLPIPAGDNEFVTCPFCQSNSQLRRNVGKLNLVLVEPHWETCEITFTYEQRCFWANAIGPEGQYSAGEVFYDFGNSPPKSGNATCIATHRALIGELVLENWEPDGKGKSWWNERFKRNLDKPRYEKCVILPERAKVSWTGKEKVIVEGFGPKGTYRLSESDVLPGTTNQSYDTKSYRAARANLATKLCSEGWESVGEQKDRDVRWAFRRKI